MTHRSQAAAIDLALEADFTLGSAKVRPALRLFSANGTDDLLEPRMMQVLVALAQRSGGVVSRTELMDKCWSGRVVGEDALERAISRLRKLGEERGVFEIKAIPRVGYRLCPKGGSEGAESDPVLAILAFENLSPDPTLAYFAEGVSDEILQTLARARRIKVIGRTSSFQYRGQDKTLPRIASELGATHVLDGSVRCADGRIRIYAQLIEVREQISLWSREYERPARNLLALQDEIAAAVASALNCRLAERPPAGVVDAETYQLYLRARETILKLTFGPPEIEAMDRVAREAPAFAPAFANASYARLILAVRPAARQSGASQRLLSEAFEKAEQAIALDPLDPLSILARANFDASSKTWAGCEAMLRGALQRTPHAILLQQGLGNLLVATGRLAEAHSLLERAHEADPINGIQSLMYAATLGALGRDTEQFAVLERWRRQSPSIALPLYHLVSAAACARRWDIVDQWMSELNGSGEVDRVVLSIHRVVAICRDPSSARQRDMLDDLAQALDSKGRLPVARLAFAAQFCDLDALYEIIQRANFSHLYEPAGWITETSFGLDQLFLRGAERLRHDIRFVALCHRAGLTAAWVEEGRWPDCADQVRYDFRGEAQRLVAGAPSQ